MTMTMDRTAAIIGRSMKNRDMDVDSLVNESAFAGVHALACLCASPNSLNAELQHNSLTLGRRAARHRPLLRGHDHPRSGAVHSFDDHPFVALQPPVHDLQAVFQDSTGRLDVYSLHDVLLRLVDD